MYVTVTFLKHSVDVLFCNLFLVTGEMEVLAPVHHSRPRDVTKEFLLVPIHIALVFERFIFKPEHFSKLVRVCITLLTDEIFASVAVMSSAFKRVLVSFVHADFYVFDEFVCS